MSSSRKSSVCAPAWRASNSRSGTVSIARPLGAQQEATADRHLPNRSAAPDRDRVAWLDVAEFRPHIPGRKDVRKKQHLFVGELVRNFYRPNIGERHA